MAVTEAVAEAAVLAAHAMTVPAGAAVLMDNVVSGVDVLGFVRHNNEPPLILTLPPSYPVDPVVDATRGDGRGIR